MKLFLPILFIVSCYLQPLLEAKSIMFQVLVAEKWFNTTEKYNASEKQDFILGLLFHNIEDSKDGNKIFNSIEEDITLEKIHADSSAFSAGFSFYSFVQNLKKKHAIRHNVYDQITGIEREYMTNFLELLEDEFVYDPKICAKAASHLSMISIGEIVTGIPIEDIAVWHGNLYNYLSIRPSENLHIIKNWQLSEEKRPILKAALIYLAAKNPIRVHLEDLLLAYDTTFEIFKLKQQQI